MIYTCTVILFITIAIWYWLGIPVFKIATRRKREKQYRNAKGLAMGNMISEVLTSIKYVHFTANASVRCPSSDVALMKVLQVSKEEYFVREDFNPPFERGDRVWLDIPTLDETGFLFNEPKTVSFCVPLPGSDIWQVCFIDNDVSIPVVDIECRRAWK